MSKLRYNTPRFDWSKIPFDLNWTTYHTNQTQLCFIYILVYLRYEDDSSLMKINSNDCWSDIIGSRH